MDTRENIIGRIVNASVQVKENTAEIRSATQLLSARAAKCIEIGDEVFEHIL